MKTRHLFPYVPVAAAACIAVIGLAVALPAPAAEPAGDTSKSAKSAARALAKRGEYLVTTSGCNDCHTPLKMGAQGPEPDMSRMLSGHPEALQMPPAPALPNGPWMVVSSATNTAFSGPWGVSFTSNLTPDNDTGMGLWTQRQFVDAIRSGRHMGSGRPILPPMPIPAYKNFSDADLQAIYAYLRSIPTVKNRVPAPLPPAVRAATAEVGSARP